ncbi:hypothetical protein [Halomonas ramblicola]|uniref:hypothetical protein n=1 Tax=Halomonas ramblicola TaxID=747349 RepID=UPI0025B3084E|nr:hypothetical protein [Halomonas ramblicola]MDN3523520.1 hypothetical protein [Halomonas ramblicola]
MAKKKPKVDWGPMGAFSIPKRVMDLEDFRTLSPSAKTVLLALGFQYNGKNNGNLSATHNTMQEWGGMAKATLAKSLRELQDRNLIMKTRQNQHGREGARCALYAFTWAPIDDCPGKMLDVTPTITAPRKLSG